MTHLTGSDRAQTLLLPESLDDYVGADNPVRFIDAFVDKLDLAAANFARRRTRCKEMLAELDRTGEDQISLTDADSRAMAAPTRVAVG